MKPKHVVTERMHARETLKWCGVPVGADFHTLRSSHVDKLEQAAADVRYRKPRNANGSTARYFHDLMQRRAQRKDPSC